MKLITKLVLSILFVNLFLSGLSYNIIQGEQTIVEEIEVSNWTTPPIHENWGKAHPALEDATGVVVDSSGNIFVCGWGYDNVTDFPYCDIYIHLVKFDSNLNELWNKSFQADNFIGVNDMIIDSADNIYIAGHMRYDYQVGMSSSYTQNSFVLKVDSSGTMLWNKTRDILMWEENEAIAFDSNEDIIATGYSGSSGGMLGFIKYSKTNGDVLWNESYKAGDKEIFVYDMAINSANEIFVSGSVNPLGGPADIFTAKFDSTGNYLWNHTLTGPRYEDVGYAIGLSGTDIYTGGIRESYAPDGWMTGVLVKYNSSGHLLWNVTYDQNGMTGSVEEIQDLAISSEGSIIVCGYDQTLDNSFVAEFDTTGSLLWNYTSSTDLPDYESLALDASNNLYVVGSASPTGQNLDMVLLAFQAPIPPQNDGGSGDDAGDDFPGAVIVTPGTITGTLRTGDDYDYYSFTANTGALIEVSLTGDPGTDFDITLFDPTQSAVISSITNTYPEEFAETATMSGDWFVEVYRASGTGDYTLTITITEPTTTSTPPPTDTTPLQPPPLQPPPLHQIKPQQQHKPYRFSD